MPFKTSFQIEDRPVGPGHPCFVIAEAGVAHFGDVARALDLVDMAADAGADVFKTQFFDVDELYVESATEWRDRLRPRNLTFAEFERVRARCDDRGILFMATAHNESRIPWLRDFDVAAVKVGSGERNNTPFIESLIEIGKPMIVSTGTFAEADVVELISALSDAGCEEAALLHCCTSYPTPDADVNISAMDRLRVLFPGPVGYSDHNVDGVAVLAAVARGASIVERHIGLLRNVPNAQDWKLSSFPEDFPVLVSNVRRIQAMIGDGQKKPAAVEAPAEAWALKSLVAAREMPAGHRLERSDLVAKRPGGGVPPNRLKDLLGRTLRHPLRRDQAISLDDLAP